MIKNLERFFGDSIQEEQYQSEVLLKSYPPTKEEASKFQIRDEVIRPDNEVSVGTLIGIEANYLVVSAKDLMSIQIYHPRYFKPKKSK